MKDLNSLLMSLRSGEYGGSVIPDSLSLLGDLNKDVGQWTPKEVEKVVHLATEMIVLLVSPSEDGPGPGLEVMLEAWKRYLAFLKQFHALLDPTLCKRFVHILQDALLSAMESIEQKLIEGEGVSAQTFGMMNFLCQRLSASISFFVHDNKITDTCAVMGINAIASAYQFVHQTELGSELSAKYQGFFSKALRRPDAERVGGDSQGSSSTYGLSIFPSQHRERGRQDNSGLLMPMVSAVIAGLEGRLDSEDQSGEGGEVGEVDCHCCYGLALLVQTELLSACAQSNIVPLRLDGLGSAALLHLLVSATTTLIVRFPGQLQDSVLRRDLMIQAVRCYAATRDLYLRMSIPHEAEAVDAALLAMCLPTQLDSSYGSVKSEVARWLLSGYAKGAGEVAQTQLSRSLQALLIHAQGDLQSRPSVLRAAALTVRGMLLVLRDKHAAELLLFLKQFDDSSEGGHVREALWREVPFASLRCRGEHLRGVVASLVASTAQVVVECAALHASSNILTDESTEKLGQALSILSGCGRGGGSGESGVTESGTSRAGGAIQEPLVDLVSMSANRAAVQFVMKVVGYYSRYIDKLYVEPITPLPGAVTIDYSALHVKPSKVKCSLEVMLSLLQVLLGQNLPPKIVSKLLIAGQVAASLAMRVAGLCKSSQILSQLAPCILSAANVTFTTLSICCHPAFREGELEIVKSMYHSLVKAAEALSSEENKQCTAFYAGSSGSCRGGWRLWCLLQRSLAECVASFPPHLKPQARTLIPPLYLPLMSARQKGNTATIDEAGQCKYQDVYAHLHGQHEQHLQQQVDKENSAQGGASVLSAASEYAWTLAYHRGTGSDNIVCELAKHKEPMRFDLANFKEGERAKTA